MICGLANAQIPNLTFEHIAIKEGLPSNDIWHIAKDKQGFLWVGTGRGICRYDGYNFQTFDDRKLGYCSGISIDKNGDIYTSIDTKGLCIIDHKTLKISTLLENNYDDNDLSNDLHEEAYVDSFNQVWIGDNSSVKRYDPATKKLHHYPLSEKNVYQFNSFFEDSKHNFWTISELGLFQYDRAYDKMICLFGKNAINPKNRIAVGFSQAFEDSNGNIWLCAFSSGLIKFSPAQQSFTFYTKGFENQEIICAIDYLLKSIDPDELKDAVEKYKSKVENINAEQLQILQQQFDNPQNLSLKQRTPKKTSESPFQLPKVFIL